MIRNYFKTAIRNLYRDKGLVSFSLLGLSVGLATVILLTGYIRYELSYDTSYSNGDRIYRLVFQNNDLERKSVYVPIYMSNLLLNELPQIASATMFEYQGSSSFALKDDLFNIGPVHADSNFFKVFNIPVLHGDPNTALNADGNIVINRKTALQFFGKADAVGERLASKNIYGETSTFEVTGIIEEIPPNMHFKGDAVMARNYRRMPESIDWGGRVPVSSVYILLEKHADIQQVVDRLPEFYQKYNFPKHFTLQFQHVPSIHLHSNLPDEFFANSDIRYLYIFGLVALLILFVACANYINLATVRSLRRTKEIGMRKVLGSSQHALRVQFMGESFLFFGLALPIAFLISSFAWPRFSHLLYVPNQNE